MILTTLLVLFSLWLLSYFYALYRNYVAARATCLPILICPVNPDNIIYMILKVPLRPLIERILPESLYFYIRPSIYGWEFRDRYEITHPKVGPTFMYVTPTHSELWCADPEMASVILGRRRDFVQQRITGVIMNVMGPNVLTSNGEAWARQRRIIAPSLNERIMQRVWSESFKQATEMQKYLLKQPEGESDESVDGLRAIAINVLGAVGYGQPQPWGIRKTPVNQNAELTYFDALSTVINYVVETAVAPDFILKFPFMPATFKLLSKARKTVPILGKKLLEEERTLAKSRQETSSNLMSMLVRLSDKGKDEGAEKTPSANAQYLTEEEIQGNLFIFSAAGFDSTSNTMAYAVTLLAAYPKWQEWIIEEIDQVLAGRDELVLDDYETIFPKLHHCLALMYETLRLYSPLGHIQRETRAPQTISLPNDITHVISADVRIYINNQSLQCSPAIWGSDALEFRPTRWLNTNSSTDQEEFLSPDKGTYLPWSAGPRVCPGMKMAQVEFTAVIARLFKDCKVEAVAREGESMTEARRRLEGVMRDSQNKLTLQMNRPREVRLRWVRR